MRRLDQTLVIATVSILSLLGALCVYGTLYAYFAATADPEWTQTPAYTAYIERMNAMALPLVIALIAVMSLCLPKRFLAPRLLVTVGGLTLAVAAALWFTAGAAAAVALLLITGTLAQGAVVVMTLLRLRHLHFHHQAFLARLGSSLLHFGVVLFILDVAFLEGRPGTALSGWPEAESWGMAVFWVASILTVIGMASSFYHREAESLIHRIGLGGRLEDNGVDKG